MSPRRVVDRERSFGVSVGPVLLLIAAIFAWRGRVSLSAALAALGSVLVTCGLRRPSLLKGPSAWWWRLAHMLGWFNSRVLLVLIYIIVIVPVAVIRRLTGHDPLRLRRQHGSGWMEPPRRFRDSQHYRRMF